LQHVVPSYRALSLRLELLSAVCYTFLSRANSTSRTVVICNMLHLPIAR